MFGLPLPIVLFDTMSRAGGGLAGIAHGCSSLDEELGPFKIEPAWPVVLVPGLGAESATR
jgi:hypothetical protein